MISLISVAKLSISFEIYDTQNYAIPNNGEKSMLIPGYANSKIYN